MLYSKVMLLRIGSTPNINRSLRSTIATVVKYLRNYKADFQTLSAHTLGKGHSFPLYNLSQNRFKSYKEWRAAVERVKDSEGFLDHQSYKSIPSLRSLQSKMDVRLLLPPSSVNGMTCLKREAFEKKVNVPYIKLQNENLQNAVKLFKKYMLKMSNLKPIQTDEGDADKKIVLLNPLLVKGIGDVQKEFDELGNVEFLNKEVTLGYENWKAEEIIKAILPDNQEGAQGYSLIGHILHLNLREHVLPFKTVIGEVLLEKIPNITLVVNKTSIIDTTYRNFEMEVLAGTGSTDVQVKENGCLFSFDFAKVYWNPRLGTEHERITRKLKHGDILYDVMAGVGPFAIPCGKKKCRVIANDLNPHSYEALVKNCKSNKVTQIVKCKNLDGNEFIKTVLRDDLMKTWNNSDFVGSIHVTINLPAMAIEFLPSFVGLFSDADKLIESPILPLVHVYMFIRDTADDSAIAMVAEKLEYIQAEEMTSICQNSDTGNGSSCSTKEKPSDTEKSNTNGINQTEETITKCLGDVERFRPHVDEVVFVRAVAPNKNMMRVSFIMPLEVLTGEHGMGPPAKKLKSN